jgi:hypothetical protein
LQELPYFCSTPFPLYFIDLLFDQGYDLIANPVENSLQHISVVGQYIQLSFHESTYGFGVIVSSITPAPGLSSTPLRSTEKFLLFPEKLSLYSLLEFPKP